MTEETFLKKLTRRKIITHEVTSSEKLKRCLTTFDLTTLGVGSTLGLGVYVIAGQVAATKAGPAVIFSFAIAAIASIFAGLSYAEFAARVPKAGSAYVYSYTTVGEFIAFLIGWNLILEYVIGTASVARGFSSYVDSLLGGIISSVLAKYVPLNAEGLSAYLDVFAFIIIILLSVVMAFGVKESANLNTLFTAVNISVVIFVVICGCFKAEIKNWNLAPEEVPAKAGTGGFFPFGFSGMMAGAATCFYAFIGFDVIASTGEEAKNPQKSMPISIVLSLSLVLLAYLCVATVSTLMWPYYDQDVPAPLSYIFQQVNYPVARYVVSIGAISSLATSLLGALFPLPRILYAMANDGLIFVGLADISDRTHTPIKATIVSGIFAGLLSAFFDVEQLADMMSIGTLLAYTLVTMSVLILRYQPDHLQVGGPVLVTHEKMVRADDDVLSLEMILNFGGKFRSPNSSSSGFCSVLIGLITITTFGLAAYVIMLEEHLFKGDATCVTFAAIILSILIVEGILLSRQPQTQISLPFKVSWLPFLPMVSMFINFYLMLKLPVQTWLRFAVWLVLGFLMYFGYGIRNSTGTKPRDVPLKVKSQQTKLADKCSKMAPSLSFGQKLIRRKVISEDSVGEGKLKRCLSTFDLTSLGVGTSLGLGVYVLAGQVAATKAGPAVLLSFVFAAIASVFPGLCYAEFGSRVPKAGSAYVYSYTTVGEFIAFLIGWNLILEYAIGTASIARGFSGYVDSLLGGSISLFLWELAPINIPEFSPYFDLFAFAITMAVCAMLAFGVRESANFNTILTGVNLYVVIYIIIVGAFRVNFSNWSIPADQVPSDAGKGGFFPFGFSGVMSGAATVFYGFIGFDAIASTGEEAKDPQRSMPIAIVLSLGFILFAFFGTAAISTLIWPYYDQDVSAPLSYIFDQLGWPVAKYITATGAICSLSTALLGTLFPLPRVLYAMANDGLIFNIFRQVSKTTHTPVNGTLISGLFAGFMAAIFDVRQLADMMSIGTMLAYTLVTISVLILRYQEDHLQVGGLRVRQEIADSSQDFRTVQNLSLIVKILNIKNVHREPTYFTSRLCTFLVGLICFTIIVMNTTLVIFENELIGGNSTVIWVVVLCLGLLIFEGGVLSVQPQTRLKLLFKCVRCDSADKGLKMASSLNFGQKLIRRKVISKEPMGEGKLKRCLTTFDLTSLGVGSSLGLGVYVLAGQVAATKAGPAVLLSFVFAAIASVFAGLCYAEFGSRVPKAGSAYVYSYTTVGEFIAFLIGWNLILEYVIGTASIARGFSGYVDSLLSGSISGFLLDWVPLDTVGLSPYLDLFAFAITMAVCVMLAFGVQESANFNTVLTGVNLYVVTYIIIVGAFKANFANWSIPADQVPSDAGKGGFFPFGFSGMMSGAATVFYGFIGFDAIASTGEEAKDPQRSMPIAIVLSLCFILFAFFGTAAISTLIWPYYDQDVSAPLSYIFDHLGWPVAKYITAAGAICSLSTALLGTLFPLPRVLYAMASDGLIFKIFMQVNEATKTPIYATIISGIFAGLMAAMFDVQQLADMMSIGTMLAYTLVTMSVLILRYQEDHIQVGGVMVPKQITDHSEDIPNEQQIVQDVSLIAKIFNIKNVHLEPTYFTSRLCDIVIGLICVTIMVMNTTLVVFEEELFDGNMTIVGVVLVCLGLLIFEGIVLSLQPQTRLKLPFKVPWLPTIPMLSIFCNFYLMLRLPRATWIRFTVWLILGLAMYFLYGIKYSTGAIADKPDDKQEEAEVSGNGRRKLSDKGENSSASYGTA
ncbi:Cationic amino acid transporter 2 [Halotydeus destructor]|nr:Cationic amino acid transporter 2 [Halotydeus destructor]